MTSEQMRSRIVATCKAQGCTCPVDIELTQDATEPLLWTSTASHDPWCSLLARRNRRNN